MADSCLSAYRGSVKGWLAVFIGAHVGRSQIIIGMVSENGELTFPSVFTVSPEADSDAIILDIVYIIKTIAETVPVMLVNEELAGIGITIDGVFDRESGKIAECADHGLENIRLEERLQRNFTIDVIVSGAERAKSMAASEIANRTERDAGIIAAAMLCRNIEGEKD
jgi:hypothetical protein